MNRAYLRRPPARCTHPVAADAPAPVARGSGHWSALDAFPSRAGLPLINTPTVAKIRLDGER